MSQRNNDNTERPQLKENQPGILKIYVFCQKIQQKGSETGGSTAGVTYLSMRIYPTFPQKLLHSWSIVVT